MYYDVDKMDWPHSKVLCLINLYRINTCLWNTSDSNFRVRLKKQEAWSNMSKAMNMKPADVEKKMRVLIGQFQREYRKEITSEFPYKSKWIYFPALSFLKAKCTNLKAEDNQNQENKSSDCDMNDQPHEDLRTSDENQSVNIVEKNLSLFGGINFSNKRKIVADNDHNSKRTSSPKHKKDLVVEQNPSIQQDFLTKQNTIIKGNPAIKQDTAIDQNLSIQQDLIQQYSPVENNSTIEQNPIMSPDTSFIGERVIKEESILKIRDEYDKFGDYIAGCLRRLKQRSIQDEAKLAIINTLCSAACKDSNETDSSSSTFQTQNDILSTNPYPAQLFAYTAQQNEHATRTTYTVNNTVNALQTTEYGADSTKSTALLSVPSVMKESTVLPNFQLNPVNHSIAISTSKETNVDTQKESLPQQLIPFITSLPPASFNPPTQLLNQEIVPIDPNQILNIVQFPSELLRFAKPVTDPTVITSSDFVKYSSSERSFAEDTDDDDVICLDNVEDEHDEEVPVQMST